MTNNKYILGFGFGIIIGVVLKHSGYTINDVMFWNIAIVTSVLAGLIYKKVR